MDCIKVHFQEKKTTSQQLSNTHTT